VAGVRTRQSMITYNYLENQTLEDLNTLGQNDWQIFNIVVNDSPQTFDVFLQKGRTGHELIEIDSETSFWIDKSFDLGMSTFIIIFVIMAIAVLGRWIWGFLFYND
jgi:hypothetical protein